MRAKQAREKTIDHAHRQMNYDNIFKYSKSGLASERSSMVSSNPNMTRVSRVTRSNFGSNKDLNQDLPLSPEPTIEIPKSNFLQVPISKFGGNTFADQMEFFIKKKTRLLEKQKTHVIDIKNYKVPDQTKLGSFWDILNAKESDDSDDDIKAKQSYPNSRAKFYGHKRREVKKMRQKYEAMLRKITIVTKDLSKILYRDHQFLFINNNQHDYMYDIPSNRKIFDEYIKDYTIEEKIREDQKEHPPSSKGVRIVTSKKGSVISLPTNVMKNKKDAEDSESFESGEAFSEYDSVSD